MDAVELEGIRRRDKALYPLAHKKNQFVNAEYAVSDRHLLLAEVDRLHKALERMADQLIEWARGNAVDADDNPLESDSHWRHVIATEQRNAGHHIHQILDGKD